MKKAILLMLLLVILPTALAASVTRTISQSGLVTYTVSGVSGTYGIMVDDVITGGCTLSDGSTRYVTFILNPETSKSVQLTMPGSGTCTITGVWDSGTEEHGVFPDTSLTVGSCTQGAIQTCTISSCAGTQTCTSGVWGTCVKTDPNCGGAVTCANGASRTCTTIDGCAGSETCTSNIWGNCVKTVSTCGIAGFGQQNGSGYIQQTYGSCQYMAWAQSFAPTNYCTVGWCIIIGGAIILWMVLSKRKRR